MLEIIDIPIPNIGPIRMPDIGVIDVSLSNLMLVLLGVVVLIVVFILRSARGRMRRCPFCRQKVDGAATLCKHCGASLLKGKEARRLVESRAARRRRI